MKYYLIGNQIVWTDKKMKDPKAILLWKSKKELNKEAEKWRKALEILQ